MFLGNLDLFMRQNATIQYNKQSLPAHHASEGDRTVLLIATANTVGTSSQAGGAVDWSNALELVLDAGAGLAADVADCAGRHGHAVVDGLHTVAWAVKRRKYR